MEDIQRAGDPRGLVHHWTSRRCIQHLLEKSVQDAKLNRITTLLCPTKACEGLLCLTHDNTEVERSLSENSMVLTSERSCCSPFKTYGRKWGDSNFQILTELPVPHRRLESEHFNVLYIYIILSTTVSHFLTLRMPFFYKVSLFCIHFHFSKYTLHVCYVFNVNLLDFFYDRRSQCRLIQ